MRASRWFAALAAAGGSAVLWAQGYRPGAWVDIFTTETIPQYGEYSNNAGTLGVIQAKGSVEAAGHPFFTPLGTNGRACVTCHQPGWAMSFSAEIMRERWETTRGKDPVFAAIDGSNCPDLPQADPASHAMLLERGLIRIGLPWPPKDASGKDIPVEFSLEVVRDTPGCNRSARYGLNSPTPTVSVYRRPRVSANLGYVTAGATKIIAKTGEPAIIDPATGQPSSMNIMTDGREPTLESQALSAIMGHMEAKTPPTPEVLKQLVDFESNVYMAQLHTYGAGMFEGHRAPPGLGPEALMEGKPGVVAKHGQPVFGSFDLWTKPSTERTASIERGSRIFESRRFAMTDAAGKATQGSCTSCHRAALTGQEVTAGWTDMGSTTYPTWPEAANWRESKDPAALPVFKVTCRADAKPHPTLGREIYTTDPGRALITGKCADVGAIVLQQLRGLAARAPYFAGGSLPSLKALVDYYDKRYTMKLTATEKEDLVHFLEAL